MTRAHHQCANSSRADAATERSADYSSVEVNTFSSSGQALRAFLSRVCAHPTVNFFPVLRESAHPRAPLSWRKPLKPCGAEGSPLNSDHQKNMEQRLYKLESRNMDSCLRRLKLELVSPRCATPAIEGKHEGCCFHAITSYFFFYPHASSFQLKRKQHAEIGSTLSGIWDRCLSSLSFTSSLSDGLVRFFHLPSRFITFKFVNILVLQVFLLLLSLLLCEPINND